MKVDGIHYRSIALAENGWGVRVIDQRMLPWELKFVELETLKSAETAIREMMVRGAPLIGATGAYGMCLAMRSNASDAGLQNAYDVLLATRPTAFNLEWALKSMFQTLQPLAGTERVQAAYARAAAICDEDVELNKAIGRHGAGLIKDLATKKKSGEPVNVLTHCNTGWLATVDYGTALAAIYVAHDSGVKVHVWVDETRPRNQGASLTAWELGKHGVPHTVIADSMGGSLMQHGKVDMCIVGADRVAKNGDVCNKIGTYPQALSAKDNKVPFYVALAYNTIDVEKEKGSDIRIEERSASEVRQIRGRTSSGEIMNVILTDSPVLNPAFDITESRLVTGGYVTERGVLNSKQLVNG